MPVSPRASACAGWCSCRIRSRPYLQSCAGYTRPETRMAHGPCSRGCMGPADWPAWPLRQCLTLGRLGRCALREPSAAASSGSCPTAVTTTPTVRTPRVHPLKPSPPADPHSYSRMWVPADDRDKRLDIVGPENPRPSRRLPANSPSRENHSAPHAGTAKNPWSSTTAASSGPRLAPPACIPSMKSPSASSRSPNSGSSALASSHPSNVRQRPPCTAARSGASAPVPAAPRQSTGMPAHDERRGGHLAPTPPATSASSRTN